MVRFQDEARADAPPEEVWKLLYDPTRFPEWWVGIETVVGDGADLTFFPEGYPHFPMPQQLATRREDRQVVVSCLVSHLRFDWRLEPLDGGKATRIRVDVQIPPEEGHRLDAQRAVIRESVERLAHLAETEA